MANKNREFPTIEELVRYSMYEELVTISESKENIADRVKQLVFPNMDSDIAKRYFLLNRTYKRIIGKIVNELTEHKVNQGFNLKLYLYWIENEALPKVERSVIAEHFIDAHFDDLIDYDRPHIDSSDIPFDTSSGIDARIKSLFKSKTIKSETKLFQILQDNLLFSPKLITEGQGEIYGVNEEIKKLYDEIDAENEFYNSLRNIITIYGEDDSRLNKSAKEAWGEVAKQFGKTWDDIKTTQYAVINYSYGYFFLNKSPIKGARDLVDELIYDLYNEQVKGAELPPEIGREVFLAQVAKIKPEDE